MAERLDFILPPGRMVQGNLVDKNERDYNKNLIPEADRTHYFGVAVPKGTANGQGISVEQILTDLYNMALGGYQNVPQVQQIIQMGLTGPFKWKIVDGDAQNGENQNDLIRGCYLFKFTSKYEIKACDQQMKDMDPSLIKRGFYVDVRFSSDVNGLKDANAGIYLNPQFVRFNTYGEELRGGMDASTAFGDAGFVQAQGGSTTPLAGTSMNSASTQQGMPQGNAMQGQQGMPQNGVQPHTGILDGPQQGNAAQGQTAQGGGMPGAGGQVTQSGGMTGQANQTASLGNGMSGT